MPQSGQQILFSLQYEQVRVRHAAEGCLVLLFLGFEDVGSTLVTCEQVRTCVGLQECLQCLDPRKQPYEIGLIAEREHRIDKIVARTFFAERDFQAISKDIEDLWRYVKRK